MISRIHLFTLSGLSHILIPVLGTQCSCSSVVDAVSFIHHYIFTFLGSLNSTHFARAHLLVYLSLVDLHGIGNLWVTPCYLLKVVININLGTSSLIFNLLIKLHHLWLFLV